MPRLTTEEFDRTLAAFSYVLEEAIQDPPRYFDAYSLYMLQQAVEDVRMSALRKEAECRAAAVDLKSVLLQWYHTFGGASVLDK